MRRLNERGFTLPELVVATIVIFIFLVISLILLRPADYSVQDQDAKRRVGIAALAQGINRYVAATGQLPADIPTKLTAIGSPDDHYNLCKYLVPTYLNDVPLDPTLGLKTTSKATNKADPPCSDDGITYASGYAIQKGRNNQIIISAPASKNVSITIKPQQ